MKKTNVISAIAASLLLSTASFAGTLSLSSGAGLNANGHTNLSVESFQQNGMDELNLQDMQYTVALKGNAISDPTLYLNIGNLEFPFHLNAAGLQTDGFDEDGKGILGKNLQGVAGIMAALLTPQVLLDTDPVTSTTAPTNILYHSLVTIAGETYATFDGDASDNMYNGHIYSFDPAVANIPFKFPAHINGTQLVDQKLELFLESLTVTPNFQDEAKENYTTGLIPQFSVNCKAQMDGLINWENDRLSFVNAPHGTRTALATANGTNASLGLTDTMTSVDSMVFVVDNKRADDANATRWMSGAGSLFTFQVDNVDNNFQTLLEWKIGLTAGAGASIPTGYTALDRSTPLGVTGMTYDVLTKTFAMYNGDSTPLPTGKTEFKVEFEAVAGTAIKPVKFLNPTVDFEGALRVTPDSNLTSLIDLDDNGNDAGPVEIAHNYVVPTSNDLTTPVDNNESAAGYATIHAALDTLPRKVELGEWIDHAYVAQIAGVGHNPNVLSRIFITNRSCSDATPRFRVIQNGKAQTVTDIGNYKNSNQSIEISVDSQNVYQLKDIVDAAVLADATNTITASGVYSIEVILGGVAEDFYVYAQSKNSDNTNTYDLPVYNTSARD